MLDSIYSTNNNDENESPENIERILRDFEKNFHLKVDSIECSPGSQLGDNYMSVVKRIKVTGHLANGTGK